MQNSILIFRNVCVWTDVESRFSYWAVGYLAAHIHSSESILAANKRPMNGRSFHQSVRCFSPRIQPEMNSKVSLFQLCNFRTTLCTQLILHELRTISEKDLKTSCRGKSFRKELMGRTTVNISIIFFYLFSLLSVLKYFTVFLFASLSRAFPKPVLAKSEFSSHFRLWKKVP